MIVKFASPKSAKFFNPQRMSIKDKRHFFKNTRLRQSLDFKVSRAILTFYQKRRRYCISHKNGNAIVGFNKGKLGIDLEEIRTRENLKDLFALFATQEEQILFESLDEKKRLYFFYELFTLKEALIKIDRDSLWKIKQKNTKRCNFFSKTHIKIEAYHVSILPHRYVPISSKLYPKHKKDLDVNFFVFLHQGKRYMMCCIRQDRSKHLYKTRLKRSRN